jgi:hypothetical protein
VITWNVGLNSAKVVLVEHERVLLFLSHDVKDLVLDVPLHKIFQNFKIVLDNNCVAIFKRDFVDLI